MRPCTELTFPPSAIGVFAAKGAGEALPFVSHGSGVGTDYALMQCTGLTDAEGREVYEGDVVLLAETHSEVVFYKGAFALRHGHFGGDLLRDFHPADIRVVGNVYENVALLEGGDG